MLKCFRAKAFPLLECIFCDTSLLLQLILLFTTKYHISCSQLYCVKEPFEKLSERN